MIAFLLQITFCWAVFALFYHALLRKETFFLLNRGYLLVSLFGATLVPFVVRSYDFSTLNDIVSGVQVLPVVDFGAYTQQADQFASDFWLQNIAIGIWMSGSILYASRLFLGILQILRLRSRAQSAYQQDGYQLVFSKEVSQPMSFLRWVFVPIGSDYPTEILAHEAAHARAGHTIDIVLAEIICVCLWWHPLAHWHRRSLRAVHEYTADQAAVRHSNHKQYGLLLIQQAQSGPALAYVHHFFQSPLKQRILMLTKSKSATSRRWKYVLTLPMLALLLALLQFTQACKTTNEIITTPNQPAVFVDGNEGLMKFLGQNVQYPAAAREANKEGMVLIEFVINKAGLVEAPHQMPGKDADASLVAEGIRVVSGMKWTPAVHQGKKVKSKMILPIKFKLG